MTTPKHFSYRVSLWLMIAAMLPFGLPAHERWSSAGPAGHGPIGVMGDHTHGAGEWMFAYTYSRESFSGLRDGRASVSADEAWMHYDMVPLSMEMEMHMPHVMFAPSDRVTLMLMGMWMDHSMEVRMLNDLMATHHASNGQNGHGNQEGSMNAPADGGLHADMGDHGLRGHHTMAHSLSGWGDTELSALVQVLDRNGQRMHVHAGVGIPTGSVTSADRRVVAQHSRLGYPMQLGSGSWEARPGLTYLIQTERVSWGAQMLGIIRMNSNDEGWRRGNEAELNLWAMVRGNDIVSPGVRIQAHRWGNVRGADPRLDPMISPENDPSLQGGSRISAFLALNLQARSGLLAGHRLALEWGGAVRESLNGPQISNDHALRIGWEYSF